MKLFLKPCLYNTRCSAKLVIKSNRIPEEGEDFGKPVSTRDPDECMSEEIKHLINEKDYPQKRAVAAAYSICKHPKQKGKEDGK